MLRISQIKVNISEIYQQHKENCQTREQWEQLYATLEEPLIRKKAVALLRCRAEEIQDMEIVKQSIDARKKKEIYYNYCVNLSLDPKLEKKLLQKEKKNRFSKVKEHSYESPRAGEKVCRHAPVIVGFGPAGMFCALQLARDGYQPIVLERGMDVDSRMQAVEQFWENGVLMPENNVQFGEGGAGTFSDGKLNTGVKDPGGRNRKVLELFVEHGASKDILRQQKPHIGTDQLCRIVKNIRLEIERLGGKALFGHRMTGIQLDEKGNLSGVWVNETEKIETDTLVLAIGHSARDTFVVLRDQNVHMEPKAFAIGVRVEHPQSLIDQNQYGEMAKILPPADYKLTYQAKTGRNIFSFCMCPGGYVVNASSEPQRLVVNGMSNQDRGEANANSALVVGVSPEDFPGTDVLAGMEFQRKWESLAYREGKGKVPVQCYKDFQQKKQSTEFGTIMPVHKGETEFGNLWNCLPDYVCDTILEGMEYFDGRIPGFSDPDALLSGVETRTSSPVRILRDQDFESNIKGLYPCGEGAGYAGGIMSAAMDGLRVYEAIRKKYTMPEEKTVE